MYAQPLGISAGVEVEVDGDEAAGPVVVPVDVDGAEAAMLPAELTYPYMESR